MPRTSWKRVAEDLAARLVHHAQCGHPEDSPDDACPFCMDRTAYLEYVAAGGYDFRPPKHTGPTVTLNELVTRGRQP